MYSISRKNVETLEKFIGLLNNFARTIVISVVFRFFVQFTGIKITNYVDIFRKFLLLVFSLACTY